MRNLKSLDRIIFLENRVYDHIKRGGCGVDTWSELEKSVSSSKHTSKLERKVFNNELPEIFSYKRLPFPTFFCSIYGMEGLLSFRTPITDKKTEKLLVWQF